MMNALLILLILILYIGVLLLISSLTSRKSQSNSTFFSANRRSPWYLVAFGMIGSSVSGISLVSVPGMVADSGFTYLQTAVGFFVGYVVVAMVLLPLYYKLNLTSIYEYLGQRFGKITHKTGSVFYIISRLITSASKLYVTVLVLQIFVFDALKIPFWMSVTICVLVIWLYTNRGGIGTIVFTDALQSFILFLAIILMIFHVTRMLDFSFIETIKAIKNSGLSRTFVFSDFVSSRNFFKQFFSGIFIVVVMTGLSQDMMQTTLSCKNLKEARKNMLWYGTGFVPLNLLLLCLGVLLIIFAQKHSIALPSEPDKIVPVFASSLLGKMVYVVFVLGIIAATFNSADSALTGIATAIAIDLVKLKNRENKKAITLRKITYFAVCVVFVLVILLFENIENHSIIDTIYMIVGYAYGPLLGLFAFGLFTKWQVMDRAVPFLALLSPVLTYVISSFCKIKFNYTFGYEILIINGLLMFLMMRLFKRNSKATQTFFEAQ
ncbi:MAG: sodium:solute symporter [Prevotellaceae bacterium]|jgi:SSS family transporter|nr:sodium:solute symporter [Prevotellaceae bacterium]